MYKYLLCRNKSKFILINKKENENVVNKFLKDHSGYKLLKEKTVFPSTVGGDGFYYAIMVKNEN